MGEALAFAEVDVIGLEAAGLGLLIRGANVSAAETGPDLTLSGRAVDRDAGCQSRVSR